MLLLAFAVSALVLVADKPDNRFSVCLPEQLMTGIFLAPKPGVPDFVASPPQAADDHGVRRQAFTRTRPDGTRVTITLRLLPNGRACLGDGPELADKPDPDMPFVCMKRETLAKGVAALQLHSSPQGPHTFMDYQVELFSRPSKDAPGKIDLLIVDHYSDGTSCTRLPLVWAPYFRP